MPTPFDNAGKTLKLYAVAMVIVSVAAGIAVGLWL